jgi:hypothetical protein
MTLKHPVMLNEVKHLNDIDVYTARCFAALNMTMNTLRLRAAASSTIAVIRELDLTEYNRPFPGDMGDMYANI